VSGAGTEIYNILWITALQRAFRRELLGRVMAISSLASLALGPIGLAIAGPVADAVGVKAVLLFGGGVVIVCTAVLLLVPGVRSFGDASAGAA
jgi:MFS family permease